MNIENWNFCTDCGLYIIFPSQCSTFFSRANGVTFHLSAKTCWWLITCLRSRFAAHCRINYSGVDDWRRVISDRAPDTSDVTGDTLQTDQPTASASFCHQFCLYAELKPPSLIIHLPSVQSTFKSFFFLQIFICGYVLFLCVLFLSFTGGLMHLWGISSPLPFPANSHPPPPRPLAGQISDERQRDERGVDEGVMGG